MMFTAMPPLPFPPGYVSGISGPMSDVCGAGEICSRNGGMGSLIDPLAPLTAAFSAAGGIFGAITQKQIADKQNKLEMAMLKAQREQNARDFALAKAEIAKLPAEQKRTTTLIALYALGGVAVVVSGIFLIAAIRGKRK